ncbi:MAG: class I SAM-dependent methyltransferase, partial [Actinobacteria bacterium]|nr:class I SAM-dependent methyltransferase [Actinomycetota bacterium]
WLPALDGVVDKLTAGGWVADVGCGYGYSTIVMAQAFPASTFVGFDYHRPSIESARKLAAEAGVGDRVSFEVASAQEFPGTGYDLITCYDCVHDLGDPAGGARHARQAIAEDGTWMIVEPNTSERLEDNISNPVRRMFMAGSLIFCLPAALAQQGTYALGNHAGEQAIRDIVVGEGWSRWRRATETPVNLVYEARP